MQQKQNLLDSKTSQFDYETVIEVCDEIILRCPKIEDSEELFLLIEKNRIYIDAQMEWIDQITSAKVTELIIQQMQQHGKKADNIAYLIVNRQVKENQKIIGMISAYDISKTAELGYWLDFEQRGKGFASRSLQKLSNYLKNSLQIEQMIVRMDINNLASKRVAQLAGYSFFQEQKAALFIRGKQIDICIYKF